MVPTAQSAAHLTPGPAPETPPLADRLAGVLLGTALGDALGLPAERLRPAQIRRMFGRIDRYRLFGSTGFVSDDTELAALVAQSLLRHPGDPERCAGDFRRALLGWCLRLPFGAGRATLQACTRIGLGKRPSGVPSAGNGAAMRAAVVGVYFRDLPEERMRFGAALAETTHLDPRSTRGALFVAEVAARAALCGSTACRRTLIEEALSAGDPELQAALQTARRLSEAEVETGAAAAELGTTGYVVHTVSFAAYCFMRWGGDPRTALEEAVNAGGDTDSTGAILGAWLGALLGEAGLPNELTARIHDGPFGPSHLRSLAAALAAARTGGTAKPAGYSPAVAMARNLLLYPVILGHVIRRILPY